MAWLPGVVLYLRGVKKLHQAMWAFRIKKNSQVGFVARKGYVTPWNLAIFLQSVKQIKLSRKSINQFFFFLPEEEREELLTRLEVMEAEKAEAVQDMTVIREGKYWQYSNS